MGQGSGRMDTGVCITKSFHCSPETITTLFVNQLYPNTNKKFKKEKKNVNDCSKSHFKNKLSLINNFKIILKSFFGRISMI